MGFFSRLRQALGRGGPYPTSAPPESPTKRVLDLGARPTHAPDSDVALDRAVTEMLGLVRGVTADGVVNEAEVHALADWLEANAGLRELWPIAPLAERLEAIFADGVVEPHEREDLSDLLQQLGAGRGYGILTASSLPLDQPPPEILFPDRVFCFTGKFAFGSLAACEQAIVELGGTCTASVTDSVDYVVIGTFGSPERLQDAWRGQVEAAIEYRDLGHGVAIVSEDHWARYIWRA